MAGIGGGDVACGIACGDGGTHITVRNQHRSRNIHAPGLAVGIHRRLVGLGADFHRNRVACFDFITDLTRHRNGLAGFAGVNHIIGRDIIDRDRRHRCYGIHAVSMAGVRSGDITCGITRGDRRTHIAIRNQHRTGNVHTPGFAVGIDCRLVGLGADFNRDRVTRFHVVIDFTGHHDGLPGFGGIDHIIGRDIINRN